MSYAPHIHPNVPLIDSVMPETQCPVRERDGTRCGNESSLWSYGHVCAKHSEQLGRGRKLVLVNGTRLDRKWEMPGRFGWLVQR